MATEPGLSDAGLVVPRLADFLELIRDDYEAATELDIDWDADLVLGSLTAIVSQRLDQLSEALQAVYDGTDERAATGVQLSNLAQLVGVTRKVATRGQATLTLTGTPGTIVTEGKIAEGGGSDGRARWVISEDVTIGVGGTVDVVAVAEQPGRILALGLPNPEITRIVTPVPGWTSVTNAAAASAGLDAETDAALRVRRAQSILRSAGIGLAAIRSKLLALSYVEGAAVLDNPDNEGKVIEGIAMPAHSVLAVVLPATLTSDQQAEILRVLYTSTAPGTRFAGTDVTGTVTGADGFEKDVSFDLGTEVPANIVVSYTMATGYSVADASAAHQRLVEDYEATLGLGDPLTQLAIAALAFGIPGVLGMTAEINGSPNLQATVTEKIVAGSWTAS